MTQIAEVVQWLKLHPCTAGLSDPDVLELASLVEVVRCNAGDVVYDPRQAIDSICLVVNGRLKLEIFDPQGRAAIQKFQGRGGQVGGLAAALGEPQPFRCIAEDPSLLLRLNSARALEFARKHDAFRANFARIVADTARQAILREKNPVWPRVTVFFHSNAASREVSRRLITRLVQLGESPLVISDRPLRVEGVRECALTDSGQPLSIDEIRRRVAGWLPTGRVVFDADVTLDAELSARALEACEQVFWCVTPDGWNHSRALLGDLLSRVPTFRDKIRLVWMLTAGQLAPPVDQLLTMARGDVKVCLPPANVNQGPVACGGIERLVHLMRGLQIGIALGGGAARGMAHLGVLRALERNGITIDMIAGTSAGAMTGAVYSAGFTSDFMVARFVEDLRPSRVFRRLPRGEQWHLLYKYRRGQFDPMLRKYLGATRLEQLYVPMHTVTVDLISGRDVVRSRGDAVDAIVESINLPLFAPPINRNGESLVDGGLINNVPANVLAERGCNFVIAVSVTAKMELEFAQNRPDTPSGRMRRPSILQTLLRTFLVQNHNVNSMGVQVADVVIEPDVTRFDLSAFGRTAELADLGEQAAQASVPQLMAALNRMDSGLFPLA